MTTTKDDKPKTKKRTQAVRITELEARVEGLETDDVQDRLAMLEAAPVGAGSQTWTHPDGGRINLNIHSAPLIYERMATVMSEVGHIGKDRKTAGSGNWGYNFRGIDDAYNALHAVMAKQQVFCIPRVIAWQQDQRKTSQGKPVTVSILDMEFTFYTVDGSSVTARTLGEGMDSGDKSANKSMSVAQKYCLLQTFLIPTVESAKDDSELTVEPLAEREKEAPPPKSSSSGSKKGGSSASAPSKSSDAGQAVELSDEDAKKMVDKYRTRIGQVDTEWAMMQIKRDLEPFPVVRDTLRDEWLARLDEIKAGKAKYKPGSKETAPHSNDEVPPITDDDVPTGDPGDPDQGSMFGGGS